MKDKVTVLNMNQYVMPSMDVRRWSMAFLVAVVIALTGCAAPERPKKAAVDLVWPAPPEQPRIRYLTSYEGQSDFAETQDLRAQMFGVNQQGIRLGKPFGVAVNDAGTRIYVTDTKLRGVVIFDLKAQRVIMMPTDAMGPLRSPVDVKLDSQGRVYVSDGYGGSVNIYNSRGKTLLSLGKAEGLKRPTGLALDEPRNRLYVSDTPNHRVVVYDLQGNQVEVIGQRGTDPGQFNFPVSLSVDAEGQLYVVDTGNFRLQIFSPEGEFINEFGQIGDGFGSFARPKGVAADSEGHIYVLDAAFNNFQVFEQGGQLLLFVGTLGREQGKFWLPTGIFIDKNDKIYVVDSANQRVQVFQYLRDEPKS